MNFIPNGTQVILHSKHGAEIYYKEVNGKLMHWTKEDWQMSCIPEIKMMEIHGFKLTFIN
jgi:hypothetical protein